jgi:hypothetical protein
MLPKTYLRCLVSSYTLWFCVWIRYQINRLILAPVRYQPEDAATDQLGALSRDQLPPLVHAAGWVTPNVMDLTILAQNPGPRVSQANVGDG